MSEIQPSAVPEEDRTPTHDEIVVEKQPEPTERRFLICDVDTEVDADGFFVDPLAE